MRVYLPTTLSRLAAAHGGGGFVPEDTPLAGHAVTPSVREWYVEGDLEELEYAALTDAAQASLRLLAAEPGVPRRRVVVAADVPDGAVRPRSGDRFRSAVSVAAPIPLAAVASVHVDEDAAEPVVSAALAALDAADAGDDDAGFLLDEAEAAELLWYDVSELADLVDLPGPSS
jgi:hypothetical protein